MKPLNNYRRFDVQEIEPLIGREHSGVLDEERAAVGSVMLRDATQKLFRKWERRHGFQEGAGELLVPAGYLP